VGIARQENDMLSNRYSAPWRQRRNHFQAY